MPCDQLTLPGHCEERADMAVYGLPRCARNDLESEPEGFISKLKKLSQRLINI